MMGMPKRVAIRVVRVVVLTLVMGMWLLTAFSETQAKDLSGVLARGLGVAALSFTPDVAAQIAPALSGAVGQAVTRQFPFSSVSPAFTYRYSPAVDIWERATSVPGPLFSERALTLGKGKFNFGIGYAYSHFQDLNGTSLHMLLNPVNIPTVIDEFQQTNFQSNGQNLLYAPAGIVNDVIRMDLQAHVFMPTFRYGVTDSWDIGLSIPVLHTSLRVRTVAQFVVETPSNFADPTFGGGFLFAQDGQGNPIVSLDQGIFLNPDRSTSRAPLGLRFAKSQRAPLRLQKSSGSATGVGDIILRSKYLLWGTELGGVAWGLNLQLPSGAEDNFHGTGETHLSTFVYASQVLWDRFEPHLNIGVDCNTGDVERSSVLYAVGATLKIGRQLGLAVDFIGRNEFSRLRVQTPAGSVIGNFPLSADPADPDSCTAEQPCFLDDSQPRVESFFFPESFKRNDIYDFTFGFRYVLGVSGSVFIGGVIPLNDDGFRADFVPSGGVEYTF